MTRPFTVITKNLVNLLYPLHCASCKAVLDPMNKTGVCEFCESLIKTNPKPYCVICGRSIQKNGKRCAECSRGALSFDRAWSACMYEGALKELIHQFKYKSRMSLSGILSEKLISFVKDNSGILDGISLITFVPLHEGWLHKRDYNHSGILAAALSAKFMIPAANTLEKTIGTRRQNELSREERLTNLTGSFRPLDKSPVAGLNVLLVDDVMTTGATLNECAKALKTGGAKEVHCLTLARGLQ